MGLFMFLFFYIKKKACKKSRASTEISTFMQGQDMKLLGQIKKGPCSVIWTCGAAGCVYSIQSFILSNSLVRGILI